MEPSLLDEIKQLTRTRYGDKVKPTRSIAGIGDEVVTRLKVIAARYDVSVGQLAELAIDKFCNDVAMELRDDASQVNMG
jgi:hypothetical protein